MKSELTVLQKIKEAGIVVALPGDLPLQTIVPIADALLASPILAVDVAYEGEHSLPLLSDLRQRAEDKLLIGVSGVETAVQLAQLQNSPVDYISSPQLDNELLVGCQSTDRAYLPGVISVWAAQAAHQKQCSIIRLRTGGPAGADYVRTIRQVEPALALIVEVELLPEEVADYRQAGASALLIGPPLFTGAGQTMADLITLARRFTQAWQTAGMSNENNYPNGKPLGHGD